MTASGPARDTDAGFTLDVDLLAQRRAESARRVNTVQIPVVRAIGFAILCAIAVLQDIRLGAAADRASLAGLLALNVAYAALSWAILRSWYGRTGNLDLGLVFLHLDILVWLPNLRHLEQAHLYFGCLLLIRVADQVGYGFGRAIYFTHVVGGAYLAYSCWVWVHAPADAHWSQRLTIVATMYLLGIYLAFTGQVSERLRSRVRQAMHTARELVDSLEQKQRALELQAADLEEARRRAEQANVAKAQFLATISHEIRTPMNGVLGTTELLLDTPLNGQQRRLAETANHSATALLALIDDVLDLSRIEASKLALHETSFDLRALIHETVELMATTTRDKPVTLSCAISRQLPKRVQGDPFRLRQVLVNLLHNAVKFTDRGRVVLEVIVLEASQEDVELRFSVSDTGIGIAEDQFDSVFDAFTQVDASSTRRHGGSGLGLAIVKELADLMGGRVGVESQLDQGSTFWFELRLKIAAEPAAAPAPHATRAGRCHAAAGAHPARRGRRREPDGRHRHAGEDGLRRRRGRGRRRRLQRGGAQALRPCLHGLPHAGDGRLRGDPLHPRPGAGRRHAHADRRADRRRPRRRPRALPRGGNGRLHDQAGQHGAARRGGAALGRRRAGDPPEATRCRCRSLAPRPSCRSAQRAAPTASARCRSSAPPSPRQALPCMQASVRGFSAASRSSVASVCGACA